MTRALLDAELRFAEHLCRRRFAQDGVGRGHLPLSDDGFKCCPTCRADVVRLVDGDCTELKHALRTCGCFKDAPLPSGAGEPPKVSGNESFVAGFREGWYAGRAPLPVVREEDVEWVRACSQGRGEFPTRAEFGRILSVLEALATRQRGDK